MITFRARGSHIRPAASTSLLALVPLLLALGLVTAGCSNPRASHAPPLDAYALSGGKITRFISEPGLSADPTARAMLLACRQLPVTSSIAQSATLVVTTGQFGRVPLHALVVGKQVLMLPSDFATMGITFSANSHEFILYPTSPERIVFVDGTKKRMSA